MGLSVLVSCGSLYSHVGLSNLGGRGLPCGLTSLRDPSRVVDFSVCLAFYTLVGWRCDFQAPYR